jgi:propanediol dehydratase small subunit
MNKLIPGSMLVAALLVGGAATASATTDPSEPVTITLSPEQVQNLCEKRLPKIEKRVTRLLDRINGGPEVRGSVEWLRARATTERDAGRETTAQLLEERADRRAGRVDELNQAKQWATDFQTEHCEAK